MMGGRTRIGIGRTTLVSAVSRRAWGNGGQLLKGLSPALPVEMVGLQVG